VEIPAELDRYVVLKGSLTLDGISLTVAELSGPIATVAVIPHTFESTTLALRRPGDVLNLEVDVLARYIEKLLQARSASQPLTVASLLEQGF
jgi:riboflavin synthase